MRIDRVPVVLAALAMSACASHLYERSTVVLDQADPDAFDIRYGQFDGCLLKRDVPVEYALKRPSYTLRFEVGFGADDRAPKLDVILSQAVDATLAFDGAGTVAPADLIDGTRRYEIDTGEADRTVGISVQRGTDVLGRETIHLDRQKCSAMSLGAG